MSCGHLGSRAHTVPCSLWPQGALSQALLAGSGAFTHSACFVKSPAVLLTALSPLFLETVTLSDYLCVSSSRHHWGAHHIF